MSLSDILSSTDLRIIVDSKIASRSESEQTTLSVKFLKADSPSDLLTRALGLDETPVAAITISGTVYILSPGTHGLICLQGTTANKAQKVTMEKLAKAYTEATGQGLPDYYAPKADYSNSTKEVTTEPEPELLDETSDSSAKAQVDISEPSE